MPTGGIVHTKVLNIPGAVELESWCETGGSACCETPEICGVTLPSSLFVTFAGLEAPRLGYFEEFTPSDTLNDISAMGNKSYRLKYVGTATVDPTETPPPALYILADSEPVGVGTYSDDYAAATFTHIAPDTRLRLLEGGGIMASLAEGDVIGFAGATLPGEFLSNPMLLSPTPYFFTVPCDEPCINDAGGFKLWGAVTTTLDVCAGNPFVDHDCRPCRDVATFESPYSTPNPGTLDYLGFGTLIFQSTGPWVRVRVFQQLYLLIGCVDDVPYVEVQFSTQVVVYERGKWSSVDTGFYTPPQTYTFSNNRVTIHSYPNYNAHAVPSGSPPTFIGSLPYIAFIDGDVTVTLSA